MLEICLTFTPRKAKIMLLSPNMRPFCWRHRGSIADRSAGWITISLLLSAGRLPARVHNGYKCLTALKWFHQAGSIEITLAWLSTIGMSRKCFRRVASRSWFQSTAQSTPINLNWGNLLAYYWAGWPTCKLALIESRSFTRLKLWNGKEFETRRVLLQDRQKWIKFRRLLNFFFWNSLESSPSYFMNPLGITVFEINLCNSKVNWKERVYQKSNDDHLLPFDIWLSVISITFHLIWDFP